MELAERTEESADDITAAEMAPKPKNETHLGVRYCRTKGNTSLVSAMVMLSAFRACGMETSDQSEKRNCYYVSMHNYYGKERC